jgi:hypothetical protein
MDTRARVRLVACVPLCLLALALALVAFNAQGDDSTVLAAKLAKTAAKPAAQVRQCGATCCHICTYKYLLHVSIYLSIYLSIYHLSMYLYICL